MGHKSSRWLRKRSLAHCSFCKVNLNPKVSNLATHEQSQKHKTKVAGTKQGLLRLIDGMIQKIPRVDEQLKKAELQLSVAMACHCSVQTIDHLSQLISKNGEGSILQSMRLKRTKCSCLIQNVIAPALKEELKEDIRNRKYSLLLDESTDVSTNKHLAVLARYFSVNEKRVVTALLGLVPVIATTGEALFHACKKCIEEEYDMSLSNIVGLSVDTTNSNVGEHNSLWSRIREENPSCTLLKCTCHSLALVVKHAFEALPSTIHYLLAEIPAWFSRSSIRRDAYKTLFDTINAGEDTGASLPFAKYSQTRWLNRGRVLQNITDNWLELKTYFTIVESECTQQVKYKAREIKNMLNDPIIQLFFIFATPVVHEFEALNRKFQAENCDPEKLFQELNQLHQALKDRLYHKEGTRKSLLLIDFGHKFLSACDSLRRENEQPYYQKILDMKTRCQQFLEECLKQLGARVEGSKSVFKGLSYLSPKNALSQVKVPFDQLPLPFLRDEESDKIESQYRKIHQKQWAEDELFNDGIPSDPIEFWYKIGLYEDALGNREYLEMSQYALACLVMPVSNATVERIFSNVTFVKSRLRNAMKTQMLEAIIRIRTKLHFQKKCCVDFVPTQRMLELFTSEMYQSKENESDAFLRLRCLAT